MKELEEILKKLEAMEERVVNLEANNKNREQKNIGARTQNLNNLEFGHMNFAGKYRSVDGSMESVFGADDIKIGSLLELNSFDMAKVIDAFSSEERIDIVKELIQRCMTAKQLMEKLKFQTTGKLYHHLSYLEKIGVVRKDNEFYHVSSRYISSVILISLGVANIIRKNNND